MLGFTKVLPAFSAFYCWWRNEFKIPMLQIKSFARYCSLLSGIYWIFHLDFSLLLIRFCWEIIFPFTVSSQHITIQSPFFASSLISAVLSWGTCAGLCNQTFFAFSRWYVFNTWCLSPWNRLFSRLELYPLLQLTLCRNFNSFSEFHCLILTIYFKLREFLWKD